MLRTAVLACLLVGASTASARDTRLLLSIDDALKQGRDQGVIADDIVIKFGKGNRGGLGKSIGTDVSNRKTNAVNKTDVEACNWVFLSALKSLQEGARKSGASGVVEIVSYYKKNEFSSASEFECHAGAIMAGVALKATYAK
jgi:hypothetical protein